jgi:hypothetical protein
MEEELMKMTDGEKLFKQMQKIREHLSRYYISPDGTVMLEWAGGWKAYDYVAERQEKFRI